MENSKKKLLFEIQHQKLEQCFFFGDGKICNAPAIRAHSIQNRGVLEQLAEKGHVVMIEPVIDAETGPRLEYKSVGRNKATTFTGICAVHDNELFRPIDDNGLDLGNQQHQFLVAMRTMIREICVKATVSKRLHFAHSEAVKRGDIGDRQLIEVERRAMAETMECRGLLEHVGNLWPALNQCDWSAMSHTVLRVPGKSPGFACSALYAFEHDFGFIEDMTKYRVCSLNVFGDGEDTVAIFSYLSRDKAYWQAHLRELESLSGPFLEYRLSKLVLANSENLVLRPSHFQSLGVEKKNAIQRFYLANMHPEKIDVEDPNLYLFG